MNFLCCASFAILFLVLCSHLLARFLPVAEPSTEPSASTLRHKKRAQGEHELHDAFEKICRLELGKALRNCRDNGESVSRTDSDLFNIRTNVMGFEYFRVRHNPDPPALEVCACCYFVCI